MLIAALALVHLSTCSPQDPRLHLPQKDERPGVARELPPTDTELARFQRALLDLHTFAPKQELLLQKIGHDYRDLEGLMVTVARKAGARELQQLMLVARRFGTARIGEELLFQALARPLGEATRDVLATMVQLKDKTSKQALFECVRGRVPGTRRQATEMLRGLLTVDDLPFAMQLAGESALDLQLAGIELLGSLKDERAQQRLLEVLAKDPGIAGAACTELIHQAMAAVPVLQAALQQPPIDRAFAYAAFALARIGEGTGQSVLPAAAVDRLRAQLDARDAATRSMCAIALADLAFGSGDADAQRYRDSDVVEALLAVVAPTAFVPNIDLLRRPAEARLVRLAGRAGTGDARLWRDWWNDQKSSFVAVRLKVRVDPQTAANTVVSLRGERSHLRLLGEGLAALAPLAGTEELLLGSAQMLALVQGLQAAGFMDPGAGRVQDGVALPRSLEVQVPGGRALLAAPLGHEQFDRLVAVVDEVVRRELWQLYRDPEHEPDRGAFWRAECRWLEANPEPADRGRRFLRRVVRTWPQTSEALRTLAVQQLFTLPARQDLLGEDEGKQIIALVRSLPTLGERELRLLELATGTPGDAVWRDCIDLAFRAPGGGRPAVVRVFTLLGAERVLTALDDQRPGVKLAALDEVVRMRDRRAGPRLLRLLDDADADIRRAAAYTIGALSLAAARPRLIELIVANDTAPLLRRECLHSLGCIGGPGVFEVLQQAIGAPVAEDREAALRGLGELREQRSAQLLAELFVASPESTIGTLTRFYLQQQGALLAAPALRQQTRVQNMASRQQVVLLLAAWQDPSVVPDLVDMLRAGTDNLQVMALLEGITGLDITGQEDRVPALERWLRDHRQEVQWQWLLGALRLANVRTTLKPDQFEAGASMVAVPELARLLVEAPHGRLRSLAAAVLRDRTSEDYGMVTPLTPTDVLEGIAARYRILFESARAASKR